MKEKISKCLFDSFGRPGILGIKQGNKIVHNKSLSSFADTIDKNVNNNVRQEEDNIKKKMN